jgi:hypothetical protein
VQPNHAIAPAFKSSRKKVEPTGSKTLESVEIKLPLKRRKLGLTEPSRKGKGES